MKPRIVPIACLLVFISLSVYAEEMANHSHHHHHQMAMDADGMVMNQNHETLPRNCSAISQDYAFTIRAGKAYASDVPGTVFGMSQHELRVLPCSRIEVTFVNEDDIRHQWMVHGLPRYLYPGGMFHIEVSGGSRKTGTFIVPADDQTYLVHCDMAQHMEKGMRAQLVVGSGSGDLWGVAGISDHFLRSAYLPHRSLLLASVVLLISFFLTLKILKKHRR